MQVGPGDDGAVLGNGLALTADVLVEGVHFDDQLAPEDVGWKVLAVSVSDLAAMGAQPVWALLTLSLPSDDRPWVSGFARGFGQACERFGVTLIGGDTTGSPGPRIAGVTLGGQAVGRPLTRSGGRPGDDLFVTGVPGLAGAGWMLSTPPRSAIDALRHPEPPLGFALDLAREELATAAMDLSDGLAMDLPRLARSSKCGARLDPGKMPAHRHLDRLDPEVARRCRLAGGDDYQLLFAAAPEARLQIRELAARHGVRITAVGSLIEGSDVELTDGDWPSGSFDHFGEDP